ncbi:cytochrome P450 [Suillus subaureus]|uniref:Cytochrome P450 n=1 Tax=Suillus subaureus TaxID=48587 RepID=A0A9P7JGZ5_9AGAM|nr:cytochrome P450 [Suillus subaureus]KAG1821681.1 cytochrome P450 [Suillus subaureus]
MLLTMPHLLISSTFLLLTSISIRVWKQRRLWRGLPLPPGPKRLPILGNVFDLNVYEPWLTYTNWAKKYGDIVYSTILGHEFVIINTEKLAHTLLEQRSGVYSDRPYVFTNMFFGLDFNTGLLPYGDRWRQHRKMLHVGFNKEACRKYQSMQLQKVRQLLENFTVSPTQFPMHLKTLAVATIMTVTYGYDVAPAEDPFVTKIVRIIDLFIQDIGTERAALVELIPFLQYIPMWLPGGMYKRRAVESRGLARDILNDPVEYVKAEMAGGTTQQSLVKDLLNKYTTKDGVVTAEDEETIKAVAATVSFSGAETTDSVLSVFLLAMVLHPGVQIKAQEEIDRVIGDSRLPDFSDREGLPYVEAVYLETLRWRPTVPCSLPHLTSTSDVYDGYYIPKGAILLVNVWGMTHDESRFPDSMSFKPERHMLPTGELIQGTAPLSFGFGRRKCPEQYIADQSIWASIVPILATFRIGKGKDSTGCDIDVNPEFTVGFAVRPKPFVCAIEPRSANAERLIYASNRACECWVV